MFCKYLSSGQPKGNPTGLQKREAGAPQPGDVQPGGVPKAGGLDTARGPGRFAYTWAKQKKATLRLSPGITPCPLVVRCQALSLSSVGNTNLVSGAAGEGTTEPPGSMRIPKGQPVFCPWEDICLSSRLLANSAGS